MEMRRVDFEYIPLQIDIFQADVDKNSLFAAAVTTHMRPLHLAAQMGKLRDETAEEALILTYAEGVIFSSPTNGYTQYGMAEWAEWLTKHPDELVTLRLIAEAEWVPVQ